MSLRYASSLLLLLASTSLAAPAQHKSKQCRRHPEPQAGAYANSVTYTFENDGVIPDGLQVSNYNVDSQGYGYSDKNVQVAGGYLTLTVPGNQPKGLVLGGEVATTKGDFLYGSLTVTATLSSVAGTTNGFFFYGSDTQETDIEYLSDPASLANDGSAQLHFTNQDANGDGHSTTYAKAPPAGVSSSEHVYQIVWAADGVSYYVDGAFQGKNTVDTPTEAGNAIINNWSNGDNEWSAGPPAADSVLKVSKIVIDY